MKMSRPKVLLAEDEQDIRAILALELGEAGFDVTAVDNGAAALEASRFIRFDVAVTDYKMPGMDGLEATRRLRELDPDLPIIVATGYAGEDTQLQFRKCGVNNFILKPFSLAAILELVLVNARRTHED
jgi:CheY-like chemotaxis protein